MVGAYESCAPFLVRRAALLFAPLARIRRLHKRYRRSTRLSDQEQIRCHGYRRRAAGLIPADRIRIPTAGINPAARQTLQLLIFAWLIF
jgi:hypothetical protein